MAVLLRLKQNIRRRTLTALSLAIVCIGLVRHTRLPELVTGEAGLVRYQLPFPMTNPGTNVLFCFFVMVFSFFTAADLR